MTCGEAYQAILEADPSELDGSGSGPLAAHLAGCPRCRSLAASVLSQEAALARSLIEAVPDMDLERVLAMASERGDERAAGETRGGVTSILGRLPRIRNLIRPGLTLPPLAAAAVLAVLLLGREPQLPGPPYQRPETTPTFEVEVPEGRNVAVLETDNPDITVLWLF